MVMRNTLTKRDDGNEHVSSRCRPRKFLFSVGEYDVAVQKKRSCHRNSHFIYVQIWHDKTKVGYVDLTTTYSDVKTVMSVYTMIHQAYQGLGIAYRVYEGLVNEANVSITSNNQSRGAVKLWQRFGNNGGLRLYHVKDADSGRLFDSPIYEVVLNKDKKELESVDYDARSLSPYRHSGSLMLIRRHSALDTAVQKHIDYHKKICELSHKFKRFDEFRL
jgi:hypothetical protein